MSDEERRGEAHVVVYLSDIAEDAIEGLVEDFCDVLVKHGLACARGDDDAPVLALIGVRPEPFPDLDSEESMKEFIDAHVTFALPMA